MKTLRLVSLAALIFTAIPSVSFAGNWQCWESGIVVSEDSEAAARITCRVEDSPAQGHKTQMKREFRGLAFEWIEWAVGQFSNLGLDQRAD